VVPNSRHPDCRLRDTGVKLTTLATAIAAALRDCGVAESAAGLAAEAGIAVFRVAFDRWIADTSRDFPQLVRESPVELKVVTGGT
jgi:hypothetical protein